MALRVAVFGQAPFGRDVLTGLLDAGHAVVGVYAPPEGARPDPLAAEAERRGLPLFRYRHFRRKGRAMPERVAEYRALGAELNVLAYVTAFLPPEMVDAPSHGSLCFHPSLLPAYRGGSAIPWSIILGARETGVTVFRPDAGVDTGPIVVQKGGVAIGPTDTAASLYYDKLYPLGVAAMLEAANAVADGSATATPQDEAGASHQGLLDDAAAAVDWSRPADALDRLIRGCDPNPGAHARWRDRPVRLFGGRREADPPAGPPGHVAGFRDGRMLVSARDGTLSIERVRLPAGKKLPAAEAGLAAGDRLDPAADLPDPA